MFLHILAVLIYLGAAWLIYSLILKGRSQSLTKKHYLGTLLMGAVPCTFCIMIAELSFDRFILQGSGSIRDEIITAFFRAALLEEGMKYFFCRGAVKKHRPGTRAEFMLLSGMIGAGYGLIEKLVFGGGIILIVNAALPLHIFFQFLMGWFLFDAAKAAEAGDRSLRRKKLILAYAAPFFVHGCWDAFLGIAGGLLDKDDSTLLMAIGFLLFAALIAGGIIAEVKAVKKMKNMPEEKVAEASLENRMGRVYAGPSLNGVYAGPEQMEALLKKQRGAENGALTASEEPELKKDYPDQYAEPNPMSDVYAGPSMMGLREPEETKEKRRRHMAPVYAGPEPMRPEPADIAKPDGGAEYEKPERPPFPQTMLVYAGPQMMDKWPNMVLAKEGAAPEAGPEDAAEKETGKNDGPLGGDEMICPSCGNRIYKGGKFCPECGSLLEEKK